MNAISPSPIIAAANAYRDIYEQSAIDAAFLWVLRYIAVNQPHYRADDIAELDQRIIAHLDLLMTAPDLGWDICREAMEIQQAGEVFVASILAFRSMDVHKIQYVVEAGLATEETFPGLVSALGWLPGDFCHSWIKNFFISKDLNHKHLAVAACSVRREDPREYLTAIFKREDCLAHSNLYGRALRLVGELKRHDLMPALRTAMASEEASIIFWSNWSAVMLGDKSVLTSLQPFVFRPGPFQAKAIEIVFHALPIVEARAWITLLSKDPAQIRNAVKATAALGDPQAVKWLIGQMSIPLLARLAGEAFTTITGIDLEKNELFQENPPTPNSSLPNDDAEDGNVELDEDENLPYPDIAKVTAVWQKCQHQFVSGQRYFFGKSITAENLNQIYKIANQRCRRVVAMELALLQPSQFLINHAGKEPSQARTNRT